MNSSMNGLRVAKFQDLHREFIHLGSQRNKITNRLLELLPKIYEKQIYKQKGYGSIYEYAGSLAGLSRGVVDKALWVAGHIKDKPHLQAAVKIAGIHKVAMVATLATPETDKALADKVCNMNKTSLFELAKELRPVAGNRRKGELGEKLEISGRENPIPGNGIGGNGLSKNGLSKNGIEVKSCATPEQKMTIELDSEMQILFFMLKKQMRKKLKRKDINNKDVMRNVLNAMASSEGIFAGVQKERKVGANAKTKASVSAKVNVNANANSAKCVKRHIPATLERQAVGKTNGRCSYSNCLRPHDVIHHRERFSNNKSHDSIIPLCHIHHEFAHNGLIQNEREEPQHWRFKLKEGVEQMADVLFRRYRRA